MPGRFAETKGEEQSQAETEQGRRLWGGYGNGQAEAVEQARVGIHSVDYLESPRPGGIATVEDGKWCSGGESACKWRYGLLNGYGCFVVEYGCRIVLAGEELEWVVEIKPAGVAAGADEPELQVEDAGVGYVNGDIEVGYNDVVRNDYYGVIHWSPAVWGVGVSGRRDGQAELPLVVVDMGSG